MSVSIRINDEFYQEAKATAKAELRSIPNQIEFWARLGKSSIENPELSIEGIKALLLARHEESELFEFKMVEK